MTSGAWGKRSRPLKPKEGLNGPPKTLVAGVASFVIHLSTRLRESAARDDKGEGDGSIKSGCWTEAFFITLGGPQAHGYSVGNQFPNRLDEEVKALPQGLKASSCCMVYVRAEARTLQKKRTPGTPGAKAQLFFHSFVARLKPWPSS